MSTLMASMNFTLTIAFILTRSSVKPTFLLC